MRQLVIALCLLLSSVTVAAESRFVIPAPPPDDPPYEFVHACSADTGFWAKLWRGPGGALRYAQYGLVTRSALRSELTRGPVRLTMVFSSPSSDPAVYLFAEEGDPKEFVFREFVEKFPRACDFFLLLSHPQPQSYVTPPPPVEASGRNLLAATGTGRASHGECLTVASRV